MKKKKHFNCIPPHRPSNGWNVIEISVSQVVRTIVLIYYSIANTVIPTLHRPHRYHDPVPHTAPHSADSIIVTSTNISSYRLIFVTNSRALVHQTTAPARISWGPHKVRVGRINFNNADTLIYYWCPREKCNLLRFFSPPSSLLCQLSLLLRSRTQGTLIYLWYND